jgi:hypothetical protein
MAKKKTYIISGKMTATKEFLFKLESLILEGINTGHVETNDGSIKSTVNTNNTFILSDDASDILYITPI